MQKEIDFISNQLQAFENSPTSISRTEEFIETCTPILQKIKIMYSGHNDYKIMSNKVVNAVIKTVVSELNGLVRESSVDRTRPFLFEYHNRVLSLLNIVKQVENMPMEQDTRDSVEYLKNMLNTAHKMLIRKRVIRWIVIVIVMAILILIFK